MSNMQVGGPNETQLTANEPSQANLQLEMQMDDEKNPKGTTNAMGPVAAGSKKGGRFCVIVSVLMFLLVVGGAAAVIFLFVLAPPGIEPLK